MWEGEGRTLPLVLITWKTEGLSLNEKGHCRRKIWICSCKYFACLLFQGTHYIMHVKDFIRLMKNQRASILTERPVVPQFCLPLSLALPDQRTPGASTVSQGRCPWSTAGGGKETRDSALQDMSVHHTDAIYLHLLMHATADHEVLTLTSHGHGTCSH